MNATPNDTTELAALNPTRYEFSYRNSFNDKYSADRDIDPDGEYIEYTPEVQEAIAAWNRRTAPSIPAQPGSGASWDACRAVGAKVKPTDAEREQWLRERDCTLCGGMGDISDDGAICPHCNRTGKEPDSAAERDAARYAYVRCLHPCDFENLVSQNIAGVGKFDDLVDAAMQPKGKV